MLSVRGLLPPENERIYEEEVPHVEDQQADHADDHHDHYLDHSGVSLLISTNTSGTESFWKLLQMFLLHIETGDDNIEAVTVAEKLMIKRRRGLYDDLPWRHILDIKLSL